MGVLNGAPNCPRVPARAFGRDSGCCRKTHPMAAGPMKVKSTVWKPGAIFQNRRAERFIMAGQGAKGFFLPAAQHVPLGRECGSFFTNPRYVYFNEPKL